MARKWKLSRAQEIAMFAKRNSHGISSKDIQNNQSSKHTQSYWSNNERTESSNYFINPNLGSKRKIKTVIPSKKQPEPKSTQFIPKITPNKDFSKFIKPMQKISKDKNAKIVGGAIATGLTILTGNPVPLLVYKALITANTLNDLSNRMEKINLKDELLKITKQNLKRTSQEILKQKTEQISKKVTDQSQELGLIRTISDSTTLSEKATRTIFQNTVNNTIDDGIGNLTNFVVTLAL